MAKSKDKISLPTKKSKRSDELNDYLVLLHGEKKIGKTTLALQDEEAFLLTFDPPQKAIQGYQRHVASWVQFTKYIQLLLKKKNNLPYTRIVIDGVDIAHRLCQEFVCAKRSIEHPKDDGYGAGWDALKSEFAKWFDKIMSLKCGVWFICHSKWSEVETRDGRKISKLIPLLKSSAEEMIVGKVDVWASYDYVGDERALIILGDERTGAGHRIDHRFRTPEGKRVREIPMGNTAKEAHKNLMHAFNNKQTITKLKRKGKKKRKNRLRRKK